MMRLSLNTLHYSLLFNISSLLESAISLIGILFVMFPLYHFITKMFKSTLIKFVTSRLQGDMSPFKDLLANSTVELTMTKSQSAFPSDNHIVTTEPKFIDNTQVCLLPESPSDLVSGIANTGNSCFLNSVLQALSSLPRLQLYLEQSIKQSSLPSSLPVARSLLRTTRLLSAPVDDIINPTDILEVLENYQSVINREQQDAQELFQLLVSQLDEETNKSNRKQGLKDLLPTEASKNIRLDNPFNGLLAYRISCMNCGYSSGIPLQAFNNIQLNLPDATSTTLDHCLTELTKMEYLTKVDCVKCSLITTLDKLNKEPTTDDTMKSIQEIEHRIKVGDFETMDRITARQSSVKSKQTMFAKPPKILCLHFVRSLYLPTGNIIVKNACQVEFPSILDLSPYCTNGTMETEPYLPLSTPDDHTTSTKYKLMSTVVHYGDHFSGHYIAYKRKLSANTCNCDKCDQSDDMTLLSCENEWFRTSDDTVKTCETEDALRENPFMLLYELIEEEENEASKQSSVGQPSTIVQKEYCNYEQSSDEESVSDGNTTTTTSPLPTPPLIYDKTTLKPVDNNDNLTISCLPIPNQHVISILSR